MTTNTDPRTLLHGAIAVFGDLCPSSTGRVSTPRHDAPTGRSAT